MIALERAMGALVLYQSIRDPAFSYATEFIPVCLAVEPWRWSWHHGHIRRQHGAELSLPNG